jgi:shikimate kinase
MKLACNYYLETESLAKDEGLGIDYFKFPSLPFHMEILQKHGFVVYLRCTAQQLYERTAEDDNRPLLSGVDSRLAKIEELLAAREKLYMDYSDFVLNQEDFKNDSTPAELAKKILERIIC